MAKKESGSISNSVESVSVSASSAPVVERAVVQDEAPMVVQPRISFDMWFQCSDRSASDLKHPHHKAGMMSFADTKDKRTKQEWDRLFAGY